MKPRCIDITEQVTDHLEGQQRWAEWLAFRVHILLCPHCRAYLRQMRATLATLATLPGEPLPEEVEEELMRRYRDWQRSRRSASPDRVG